MKHYEGEIRIPSGCAVAAEISRSGRRFSGERIVKCMEVMHERSNGLGGGFAAYGIYPEYSQLYAFHIFYDSPSAKEECERFLERHFETADKGDIPTRLTAGVADEPIIMRYFLSPLKSKLDSCFLDADEYTVRCVFRINTQIKGAYVFSSGKNMGVFKGVGFPEDIGRFYRLEEYEGTMFTAHGRYPTNTPGWWGGAHPFALLNYSIVHNGEISSYDANRRNMEMYGYKCTLQTDTEVITYIMDYLLRRRSLTLTEAAQVIAAPFWSKIDKMPKDERTRCTYLRKAFSGLLVTGPFSIILGFENGLMALNDRLKLRSMVVGEKDDMTFIASEECALRVMEPSVTAIRAPEGGEPVIVTYDKR